MLAGLLFATADADDRPDLLAATLPIGGVTLLEYQARLLLAAGAAQIIVVVARVTPELSGAINRIARRGVAIDAVRGAGEALAKAHPLARLLMLADGLITTAGVVDMLAQDGGDALLVTGDADAMPGFERVGANAIWAGVARIERARLVDAAALPRDYDPQSTLLRIAAQAGAKTVALPLGPARDGHGLESRADALDARGRRVLAAQLAGRRSWTDRFIVAPLARALVPRAGGVGALSVAGGAGAVLLIGLVLTLLGWVAAGVALGSVGLLGGALAGVAALLKGEEARAAGLDLGVAGASGVLLLAAGEALARAGGRPTPLVLAVALVIAAVLAERAAGGRPRRAWWATPLAYPLLLIAPALLGLGTQGLALLGLYAAATLASAIERLREEA